MLEKAARGLTSKFPLSYYEAIPPLQLSYENFKEHAHNRLKVHRLLERKVPCRHMDISFQTDLLEHACLCLVSSQDPYLTLSFANNETLLFRNRLEAEAETSLAFFQTRVWPHLKLPSTPVLVDKSVSIDSSTYYDPDHLNMQKFPLERGYFRLSGSQAVLRSYLVNEFRRFIERRTAAVSSLAGAAGGERFLRLSGELFDRGINEQKNSITNPISRASSFPLCIQGIIEKLKEEGHLKFDNRQVLCRFFKDIGVEIEETVGFFRSHFRCSHEQFNKNYLYFIRHNYGLEGRHANYTSFTCNKLIGLASSPSAFGCPFVKNRTFVEKHMEIEDMGRDALSSCCKYASKVIAKEVPSVFSTPAEYFRLIEMTARDCSTGCKEDAQANR